MAYRALGIALSNRSIEGARASKAFRKAFQHRDCLTESERYLATATYGIPDDRCCLETHPLMKMTPSERPYRALGLVFVDAGKPGRARESAGEITRSGEVSIGGSLDRQRHAIEAALAIAERRTSEALTHRDGTQPARCIMCFILQRARAFDRGAQSDSAIAMYEKYVAAPFFFRLGTDWIWLPIVYQQLGELLEQRGDAARAAAPGRDASDACGSIILTSGSRRLVIEG